MKPVNFAFFLWLLFYAISLCRFSATPWHQENRITKRDSIKIVLSFFHRAIRTNRQNKVKANRTNDIYNIRSLFPLFLTSDRSFLYFKHQIGLFFIFHIRSLFPLFLTSDRSLLPLFLTSDRSLLPLFLTSDRSFFYFKHQIALSFIFNTRSLFPLSLTSDRSFLYF